MRTDHYIVISRPDPLNPRGEGHAPPCLQDLSLASAHLDRETASTISRSRTTLGIVRASLPLRLIEPVARDPDAAQADHVWGLDAVGATGSNRTGRGVTVAVLDSGCDLGHPAFARIVAENRVQARNFTSVVRDDASDDSGHGTHCAGTICGGPVDGRRIGVAPGIEKLLIGKVLGPGGNDNASILRAMQWAAHEGATIISMSLGIDFPRLVEVLQNDYDIPSRQATSMALREYRDTVQAFGKLAEYLAGQGVLVVAASGNESKRPLFTIDKSPPAASESFFSVGAVRWTKAGLEVADFSNSGADVVGPGVDILSAKRGGGLVPSSGTSMAAPHAAGVAALWAEQLAERGPVTHQELKAMLLAHALAVPGSKDDVGAGLVAAPV